jgi:predicted Zn-ribbon and HTH transcriptional regulator
MGHIQVEALKCERCGHVWMPRNIKAHPKVCPKCKSPYWDIVIALKVKLNVGD